MKRRTAGSFIFVVLCGEGEELKCRVNRVVIFSVGFLIL